MFLILLTTCARNSQEKGLSNEEFLLKIAETYDIKRVFVSSVGGRAL